MSRLVKTACYPVPELCVGIYAANCNSSRVLLLLIFTELGFSGQELIVLEHKMIVPSSYEHSISSSVFYEEGYSETLKGPNSVAEFLFGW